MPRSKEGLDLSYSQLVERVDDGQVREASINPNKNQITATLVDGEKAKVHYPSDQSLLVLETKMRSQDVKYDSKGRGSSLWVTLLTGLLPFILLFGFWIFLMNQVQGGGSKVM